MNHRIMYYIVDQQNEKLGPFDLVSMMNKIRTGRVREDTLVNVNGHERPQPAMEVETLAEFFQSLHEQEEEEIDVFQREYDLKQTFISGIEFLKSNQSSYLYTGLYLVACILCFLGLKSLSLLGYFATAVLSYVMLAAYMMVIIRVANGQAIDMTGIMTRLTRRFSSLALAAVFLAVVGGIGAIFLIAPGLLVLTFYVFTPLLILDKGMGFWESLELSRKTVLSMGSHNLGVLLALMVANFLGGVFFVFPLLFTLPLTVSALVEIYEDSFGR